MSQTPARSKIADLITKTLLIVVLAAIAWMLWPAAESPQYTAPPVTPPAANTSQSGGSLHPVGLPVRLQIPAINVDAAIQYVGLTAQGAMGVPSSLNDVAWYQPGFKPGEAGNAVVAGHHSSRGWVPAVFDNLNQLKPGDNIVVIDDQGQSINFVVRESRIYAADANPAEIYAGSDQAHLNLITCTGKFDVIKQSFPQRLVVFADFQS